MKPSKESFKKWVREFCSGKEKVRILDLGSGTSNNFIELIKELPQIEYTGVEPYKQSYEEASKELSGFLNRTKLYNESAYSVPELENQTFDLVCSLSVIEHVKQLDKFLKFSASKVATGGTLLHLWDNAHELMAISLKEKIQCWLSNHLPALVPELKFAHAVYPNEVIKILESEGLKLIKVDYYHLKSTIKFINMFRDKVYTDEAIQQFISYENFIKSNMDAVDMPNEFVTPIVIFTRMI